MLTLGIILCYLLGTSVLLAISRKYSLAELIGYSYLIGMGLETFFLFLLDVVGVHYSAGVLIGINLAAILAINGANYKGLMQLKDEFKIPSFSLKDINLVAVVIFCLGAYLFYAITVKNLFWPPSAHDAIGSFDKLGKIMALEGKLKISLFKYELEGAGGVYPPLFHGSFAYMYIFGAVLPKISITLFFLSLLTTFYALLRKYVDATAAMLITYLMMITPEMFSHAALALGNMPTTAYVSAGALATFVWLDKRDVKYFWLGAITMAFVIWIRSDTIVFTAAALLIMGMDFLRTKDFKKLLVYSAIAVAPFIIWMLYLKLSIHANQTARFNLGMGYNSERMDVVTTYINSYLFAGSHGRIDGGQLYGIVFIVFALVILVNLALIFVAGAKTILTDKMYALLFFFGSFFLYFLVFYLIDEKAQRAPIASLMESSFKRGLFCFVPLAWFYVATSYGPAWLFNKVERFRMGE